VRERRILAVIVGTVGGRGAPAATSRADNRWQRCRVPVS